MINPTFADLKKMVAENRVGACDKADFGLE
jgi:hypothetical protein